MKASRQKGEQADEFDAQGAEIVQQDQDADLFGPQGVPGETGEDDEKPPGPHVMAANEDVFDEFSDEEDFNSKEYLDDELDKDIFLSLRSSAQLLPSPFELGRVVCISQISLLRGPTAWRIGRTSRTAGFGLLLFKGYEG